MLAAGWFAISCARSGIHTAAVSGGPTLFTLNPDVDFEPFEVCTVYDLRTPWSQIRTLSILRMRW